MEVAKIDVHASGEERYPAKLAGVISRAQHLGPHRKIRPKDTNTLENGLTLDVEPDHAAGDQGAQCQEHDCSGETLLWKEQNQLAHDVEHEKAGTGIQKGPCTQRNTNDDADEAYPQGRQKDGHLGT